MKEVTLKIPDKKLDFFIELVNHLGIEVLEETDIPEVHKSIVRKRIKKTNPGDMIPWKEARKQFTFK